MKAMGGGTFKFGLQCTYTENRGQPNAIPHKEDYDVWLTIRDEDNPIGVTKFHHPPVIDVTGVGSINIGDGEIGTSWDFFVQSYDKISTGIEVTIITDPAGYEDHFTVQDRVVKLA